MSTIISLAKFFEKEKYADDFVRGKVYCNTLRTFKKMKDKDASGRFDNDEGTTAWLQPDEVDIQMSGINFTGLAAPVQLQMYWLNHVRLFCMVAGHTGTLDVRRLSTDDIEELRSALLIPETCLQLGKYAVLVTNVTEFIKRMDSAVGKTNYRYERRLVKYYDPETFHGDFRDMEAVFWKQDHYSYQREYRFALLTGQEGDEPFTLEIGDISDITTKISSADLRDPSYLQVNVAPRD